MSLPKAVLKRLKPLLEPNSPHNPIIRSFRAGKQPTRRIATSSSPSSSSQELNLQALRSLAKHLFTRSVSSARQSALHTNPTSSLRESLGRLGAATARGGRAVSFQPSAATFRTARVGLGGMSSAPMGPAARVGMRSVGNVGLGNARAYSSAATPLFNNLANTPLVLRALANSLEDKLESVKTGRPTSSISLKPTTFTSSRRSSSLFQSSSILSLPEVSVTEPTDAELYATYFSPSSAHTLPAPSTSSSSIVTTLLVPFSIPFPSPLSFNDIPLPYLAQSHRQAYEQHASRVDGLIDGLTERGAFLDDLVWMEQVRESDGGVLGHRVIFEGRSEPDVEHILQEIGQGAGQGHWFFLVSKRLGGVNDDTSPSASFIFPTCSFSSSTTFNSSFVSPSLAEPLVQSYDFPSGASTPLSISSSPSSSSVHSLSDSEMSLDGSESVFLGFSSSFLSDREQSLVGSVMSF